MVTRGDVWWYEPPHEQARPHLVLTRNEAIPILNTVVTVPATRTIRDIPSQVYLDRSDGMPAPCALAFDQLRYVEKAYLTRRITTLAAHRWPEVREALTFTLAC